MVCVIVLYANLQSSNNYTWEQQVVVLKKCYAMNRMLLLFSFSTPTISAILRMPGTVIMKSKCRHGQHKQGILADL